MNLLSPYVVLHSNWVAACLKRGQMLGHRWKPEWGGFRLKYFAKAEIFDESDSENIKEVSPHLPFTKRRTAHTNRIVGNLLRLGGSELPG